MKSIFVFLLLLTGFPMFCQKKEDSKIIITTSDSLNIYNKVRIALVKNNFIVKDDGNKEMLTTYPRPFVKLEGYSILAAELAGNKVVLSGIYGLKKLDGFGFTSNPKNYKPIIYYKGSKAWLLLKQVADSIGSEITFSR